MPPDPSRVVEMLLGGWLESGHGLHELAEPLIRNGVAVAIEADGAGEVAALLRRLADGLDASDETPAAPVTPAERLAQVGAELRRALALIAGRQPDAAVELLRRVSVELNAGEGGGR